MKFYLALFIAMSALLGVFFIGKGNEVPLPWHTNSAGHEHQLTIYKSPTCGCCTNYVGYMRQLGYKVEVIDTDNMETIKEDSGVANEMYSCHTTVVNNGQYFIEGHIPNEAVSKLLEEEPEIKGIGMPGMPMASPGMPGEKMEPFEIMQLNTKDELGTYVII